MITRVRIRDIPYEQFAAQCPCPKESDKPRRMWEGLRGEFIEIHVETAQPSYCDNAVTMWMVSENSMREIDLKFGGRHRPWICAHVIEAD